MSDLQYLFPRGFGRVSKRHALLMALMAVAILPGSIGSGQPSPFEGCRELERDCTDRCSSWRWRCTAAPLSLRPLSTVPDDDGWETNDVNGNCGACLFYLWPHFPNFDLCGPPFGVTPCV